MPPHTLILKPNSTVMLLRNLDIKRSLGNGTRLMVVYLHDHVIDAEILTGNKQGERVLIPKIELAPFDANLPFILERIQFPLRLSYSMTINKSQGQTFDKLGISLPDPVFSWATLMWLSPGPVVPRISLFNLFKPVCTASLTMDTSHSMLCIRRFLDDNYAEKINESGKIRYHKFPDWSRTTYCNNKPTWRK